MTTLVAICQNALRQTGRYNVPTSIIGNTDPTAVRCLALVNLAGTIIGHDYPWQALITSYTFSTSNGTANYALPTPFNRFANLTNWDHTNFVPIRGPVSPIEWNRLQQSVVSVGSPFYSYFRIAGGYFSIYPTPTSTRTIGFDYFSKYWISGKTEFTADTDEPLISATLLTLALRWMFLQALGDEYEKEEQIYRQRLDSLQGADGGRGVISFNGSPSTLYGDNLPDVNLGT